MNAHSDERLHPEPHGGLEYRRNWYCDCDCELCQTPEGKCLCLCCAEEYARGVPIEGESSA